MSQFMEVKMCDNTPTSMSLDSGSSHQFPNPQIQASIKEPMRSPLKEGVVLNNIYNIVVFLHCVLM